MANATSRLDIFRSLLEDAHRALALSFGFELWDGSSVPRDLAAEAMRLVIAKESVIASLVRRPTLDTVVNAHVAGLLDLRNGTIFDLAAQRPQGKVGRRLRSLSKLKAARAALQFLRAPADMPRPLDPVKAAADARDGQPVTNKRERRLSLRRVERLLPALPRSGDGLHLRVFPARLARRPRPRAARQARHDLPQAAPPAGRAPPRHRLRLGRADLPTRRSITASRATA